jgi:DNA-3-methyladenine glycosylase II
MERDILIETPEIFSFRESLWYLDRNFDDVSHRVEGNSVMKAIRINGKELLFRLSGDDNMLIASVVSGEATEKDTEAIGQYVRKWLDLDTDIAPFYQLLKKDDRVACLAEAYFGFRMVSINELYEALSWSIIGQQINLSFAFKIKRRITEKYGTCIEYRGNGYYIFPEAKALAEIDPADLRPMQFSQRKAEYLVGLSQAFASGKISEEIIRSLPGFSAKQQFLTNLRGIGIWTANYALMKSMHIPEAVPYGDAGLFIAMEDLGIIDDRSQNDRIQAFFDQFSGWQHYMVYYLWRSRSKEIPAV